MPTLYPPIITALPTAAASTTASTNALTVADAYGQTLQARWLGEIADAIILASKSGKRFVDIEGFKVTSTNGTALTSAGYTLTPATFNPTTLTAVINPNQIRVSWT